MRITCPYCGERGLDEFLNSGDATARRPHPSTADPLDRFIGYAYTRTNPAGPIRELWYHAAGCHVWVVVTRDTRTHAITDVEMATSVSAAANAHRTAEACQ